MGDAEADILSKSAVSLFAHTYQFVGVLAFGNVTRESAVTFLSFIIQIVDADLYGERSAVFGAVYGFDGKGTFTTQLLPMFGPSLLGKVRVDVMHRHG